MSLLVAGALAVHHSSRLAFMLFVAGVLRRHVTPMRSTRRASSVFFELSVPWPILDGGSADTGDFEEPPRGFGGLQGIGATPFVDASAGKDRDYPARHLVGKIYDYRDPLGLCSDADGNVYVSEYAYAEITEYAHGATSPT